MRLILLLLLARLVIPAFAWGQPAPRADRSPRVAYTAVRDTASGARLPRLTNPRTPQMRAINRQLDSISAGLRCWMPAEGMTTEHWADSRATYARDEVLSVFIRFSGFCGGVHPIVGENVSVTFDLRTGRAVPFRELFADYERDAHAIVRALFPEKTAAGDRGPSAPLNPYDHDGEQACLLRYATEELAKGWFSYALTYQGLVAEPEFGHAIRRCQEPSLVPYERLRPFAAPGSILERVAAARAPAAGRPE